MPSKLQRLFVKSPLRAGAEIALTTDQAHYLANVLRSKTGDRVLVFNGVDGEWCARLSNVTKKAVALTAEHQTRPHEDGPDLHYLFAPIKRARVDYMAQKATEMGVSRLQPVLTRRTITERVKTERLQANAIEAAEQCGILRVPEVAAPAKLDALLEEWDAVLIGPEGGFEPEERAMLLRQPFVIPVSLGPRIMRADTAAVACLALVNAVLGDWR
jgi:16S rRNA (uracil1498-N3)-methyltransferase